VKPFQFSTPASAELADAVRWYETRRNGLGADFYEAVVRAIEQIRTHPDIGTLRAGRLPYRRVLVSGFPYQIVYRVRENDLYVIAIAHTSRRPGFWQGRQ
jgi:plasmid stabilization system protein ParE